jgi:hypothetical protein
MARRNPSSSDHASGVKARLREELHKYLAVSGYLYVCFVAIVLFKMAVLRDAGVAYLPLGLAAAKALILGKFVLIGEAAHVGSRVQARTLLHRIVRRVALLFLLLVLLLVVEELLVGWFHGHPLAQTLAEYRHRLPELLAMLLLLLLILVPLVGVTEFSHARGPRALRDLLLEPPGQASAADVPPKSRGSGAS